MPNHTPTHDPSTSYETYEEYHSHAETYEPEEVPQIDLQALEYEAELIIANAEKRAHSLSDEIIDNARNQAKKLETDTKERLKEEIEELKEETKQKAYDEAMAEAQLERDGIIQEANQIKQDAHDYREELIKEVEPEMVNLMIDILDHLIGVEKETNAKTITTLIKSGLQRANPSGKIVVHVSTADYPHVDKDEIFQHLDTMAELEILEDPTIRRSGCIIETEIGTIDSSLDTQYKALRKNLKYILKNR